MTGWLALVGALSMDIGVIERARAAQQAVGEAVQPPADPARIAAAEAALRRDYGAALPADHAALLRVSDGVDFDGLVLYGSWQSDAARGPAGFWQGLVEANRLWREGPGHSNYLVLGETDMDLLTVGLDGKDVVLRDKVSGDVNERFDSVGDAIERLLATRA